MNIMFVYSALCSLFAVAVSAASNTCVCTTVSCPVVGKNTLAMGKGTAKITYNYELHGDYPVVVKATGTVMPTDLDHGTDTTSCTQEYARMLEDDGNQNCDAGHILANRLGGYGNQPINIFPQDYSVNRGAYAQFEDQVYHCLIDAKQGDFEWQFTYVNSTHTKPHSVEYSVSFSGGKCGHIKSSFPNGK